MSNDKNGANSANSNSPVNETPSWRGLFGSVVDKVADLNLNPVGMVKDHMDTKSNSPRPFGQQQAELVMKEANAMIDHAKAVKKVYKITDGICDELEGLAKLLEKLDGDAQWIADIRDLQTQVRDTVGNIPS